MKCGSPTTRARPTKVGRLWSIPVSETVNSSGSTSPSSQPRRLTAKQRRKQEQRKQLITAASIIVLVLVVIGAVLGFNQWSKNRDGTDPADLRVIAVVNGEEFEVPPYQTCELDDKDCAPGEPYELELKGADKFTLRIPEEIHDHDWAMLHIFDHPGANTEEYHKSYETTEVEVLTTSEKRPEDGAAPMLNVVEIQSLLVGRDADGEETPISAIWSIAPIE